LFDPKLDIRNFELHRSYDLRNKNSTNDTNSSKRVSILEGFKLPKKAVYKTNKSHLSSDVRRAFKRHKQKNNKYQITVSKNNLLRLNNIKRTPIIFAPRRKVDSLSTDSSFDLQKSSLFNSKNSKRHTNLRVSDALSMFSSKFMDESAKLPNLNGSKKKVTFNPVFISHQREPKGRRMGLFKRQLAQQIREVEALIR
jgi:hypothetical protein